MTTAGTARHLQARPELLVGAGEVEAEYAKDTWDAQRLGVPSRRGRTLARFGVITQPWLREAIKRWSRYRLGAGYSFTTIDSGAQSLARFSQFLARHPDVDSFNGITRELLEGFLVWITAQPRWSTNTRHHTITFVKVLLDWGHRHGTLTGLPANAVIYEEEVSRPPDQLPRFIPEFVMNQLESEANLARLRNPTVRHLVVLLMETGLRGGDACVLPFNPIVEDSVGWPCLRFDNSKVAVEQLIPLSAKAAATIRAQQAHVLQRWPAGSPWLFPGIELNRDGTKPYAHASLSHQLGAWQKAIDLRDEASLPVRVHAHQFRHTVGTRLINAGVPQHVIQKLPSDLRRVRLLRDRGRVPAHPARPTRPRPPTPPAPARRALHPPPRPARQRGDRVNHDRPGPFAHAVLDHAVESLANLHGVLCVDDPGERLKRLSHLDRQLHTELTVTALDCRHHGYTRQEITHLLDHPPRP